MQNALVQFDQKMHQYMGDKVAKLADKLDALSTNLQDIQKNHVSEVQLKDLVTGGQVQAVRSG